MDVVSSKNKDEMSALKSVQDENNRRKPQLKSADYYTDNAYHSSIWQHQVQGRPQARSCLMPLPFGDIRNVIPNGYIEDTHDIIHSNMHPDEANIPFRFDHESLCMVKGTRDGLYAFCKWGAAAILLNVLLLILITIPEPARGIAIFVWMIFLSIGGGAWVLTRLPLKLQRRLFGDIVKDLEFNRRTGMVTKWRYSFWTGKQRKVISKPFVEFVAYRQTLWGRMMGIPHFLYLYHKGRGQFSIGSKNLINLKTGGDVMAFWDFLQCYMDISQPLPDSPLLEVARSFDPVTREHDKRNKRPERYWRDMSKQQMRKQAYAMFDRIERLARGIED